MHFDTVVFTALLPILFLGGCTSVASNRPENLGLVDGRLAPCPKTPNCVSSMTAEDDPHYIASFSYGDAGASSREEAVEAITKILEIPTRDSIDIIEKREDYIRAEFVTRLWKFVDDVEFYFPKDKNIIHFRSASRIGVGDLGVNGKRMERIRDLLANL